MTHSRAAGEPSMMPATAAGEPPITPPVGLVDTHAHLMDAAFDADREAVFARAHAAGLTALLLVGYDLSSSRAAVALAARTAPPQAFAAVGIHPNSAAEATPADFAALAELASDERVVAIGETGLDYYRHHTPPARQREAFDWHLRLAEERRLPVIVHNRQADADVAAALEAAAAAPHPAAGVPAILHCFSSDDPAYLERMLAAGVCVSFAGPLTFKNGDGVRAMAARVPLDRLLVETDCPYMAPVPHRGQRNEPAFVRQTAAALAAVHHVSIDALERQLWHNSVRVVPAFGRHLQEVG